VNVRNPLRKKKEGGLEGQYEKCACSDLNGREYNEETSLDGTSLERETRKKKRPKPRWT